MPYLKENVWHYMAYARLVGLRALDRHRTNRWQLSRPDEQNDTGLMPFVIFGSTILERNVDVDPTNWSYVDSPEIEAGFIIQFFVKQEHFWVVNSSWHARYHCCHHNAAPGLVDATSNSSNVCCSSIRYSSWNINRIVKLWIGVVVRYKS